MSKITRVFQNLFGSTGDVGDFGQCGSLPLGTKVNTKDPATIQSLSAFLVGLKAMVASGTYKMPMEDLNSLFLLAFYQIAYLMEMGMAEWDASTTYYVGSLVNVSGTIYRSLTDANLNNSPASSPSNWVVASGVVPGTVQDFAGPVANLPAGYLVCDGAAVSRSTYASLFAAIGTYWGAGDSSTTFNLPNLKGAVTAGYDASQTEFNAVGKMGGEKVHTLTTDEMPSHTHNIREGNNGAGGGQNITTQDQNNTYAYNQSTDAAGGGQGHNNLQPYGTVLKIIKY